MNRFHLSADDFINVEVNDVHYNDTKANFVLDAQGQVPALPLNAVEWNYIDDGVQVLNRVFDSKGNQLDATVGNLSFINSVITGINVLRTRQAARNAAPIIVPTPPDMSVFENIPKSTKALGLALAVLTGKTPAQVLAAYRTAWDSLP